MDGQARNDGSVLYGELAPWWPLFSSPADYEEEAAYYCDLLFRHGARPPRSLLELGSGGGNNAFHMKAGFEHVTLVDLSPDMLEVSRALNPECEHVVGDMRRVRLERTYDCVFVHDAICYATTRDDLRRTLETAFIHCEPGGVALFAPDFVRENFLASTEHGGEDGADGRGVRFVAWTWDPEPGDSTYVADYAVLLREVDGSMRVRQERHVEGIFSMDEWLEALAGMGFTPQVETHRHEGVSYESVVFVGLRAPLPDETRAAIHRP